MAGFAERHAASHKAYRRGDDYERPRHDVRPAQAAACRVPRCAADALRRAHVDCRGGARSPRPRRIALSSDAARRGGVCREHRRRRRARQAVRRAPRAADPVRRRHLDRRAPARRPGRRDARSRQDEPRALGQRRGPDRHRRARRHAQAAQRRDQGHRLLLPDRSRRRCDHRRHDRDARQRHQRRALRHDARERARRHGRHRRRQGRSRPRGAPRNRAQATTSRACSSAAKARSA